MLDLVAERHASCTIGSITSSGSSASTRRSTILAGLGFAPGDENRDIGELSGGWKMRGVLAGLLFQRPDVLLLDEPTNHLDMPSVAWFSEFLKKWNRCFVLISHDREFLNEQISRVVSLEPEGMRSYPGNYEKYVAARAEEETILAGRAKNLAAERERLTAFVNRFRAQANKARAVQSRVKMLEKMESVEQYEKRGVMRFSFPPTDRTVARCRSASRASKKAYGEHVVFPGIDLTVRRGEKIGIIGVNGAGKTTLLRMIAGELPARRRHDQDRQRRQGRLLRAAPRRHARHELDRATRSCSARRPTRRRRACARSSARSCSRGDDVEKPAKVLSGGERARVALARLLRRPGNLLLMDEPTNHLDLASSESLAQSLTTFDGTLVFVSHNRSLIRTLATKIWNVEDGRVETYPGTLDEYMYSMAERRQAVAVAEAGVDCAIPAGLQRSLFQRNPRTPRSSASAARPRRARRRARSSARSRSRSPSSRSASASSRRSRRCARPSSPIPPCTTTRRAATSCSPSTRPPRRSSRS